MFKCPVNSTKEVRTDPNTTTTKHEGTLNYSIHTDEHNWHCCVIGAPLLKSLSVRITRSDTSFASPEMRPATSSMMDILGRLLTM